MSVRRRLVQVRELVLRHTWYRGAAGPDDFYRAEPPALPATGPFAAALAAHAGPALHKWTHFAALYDRYLARFAGRPMRLLEIGINRGGSLVLWRSVFGDEATIVGLDCDPAAVAGVAAPAHAYLGDQADPALLAEIGARHGPFDIVIDDGSHIGADQAASLRGLWPWLAEGGLFVIEDTMTAYVPGQYRGGYRRRGTAATLVKQLVDDQHAWVHRRRPVTGVADIAAIHVHPTIVFLEKGAPGEFTHSHYGAR